MPSPPACTSSGRDGGREVRKEIEIRKDRGRKKHSNGREVEISLKYGDTLM